MLRDLAENDGLTAVQVSYRTRYKASYFCVHVLRGEAVGIGTKDTLAEAYREALADLKEAVA